ncbi:MAG: hypothetical protein KDE31_09285 [Caldilineaceae bacterium]|nr:hypothetical protein [Caldilineaceae bacterium]
MTSSEEPQFPTLADDVRAALKQWHGDANAQSPLGYLYLFRKIARERQERNLIGERGVTNQLLCDALTRLRFTNDTDAEFLQFRFLDLWPIQRLTNQYNVAESTAYTMQTHAIERLAETLRMMEIEASAAHKELLRARLEPASYTNLVGMSDFVAQLEMKLTSADAPWLIALEGLGGIGKTSLADFVTRRLIQQGTVDEVGWVTARQTWINLGGLLRKSDKPALTAKGLVERLAAQLLPDPNTALRLSLDELLATLQRRLRAIPHLIVVDNLETVVDVESLLPTLQTLVNPSRVIMTSRESLRIAPNIYHLKLNELSRQDALTLIRQEALLSNLPLLAECTDETLLPLIKAVGGNPLALRLVAGQTHVYSLESIVQDLIKARSETVENLYTFIYRRAWDGLDAMTKKVFLAMPLAQPGGESLEFLAGVCQLESGDVRRALNNLVLFNLVDARGGINDRRYAIHSLTRTFLQEQVARWRQ